MLRNKGIWGLIGIIGLFLLINWEVMGKEPLKAEALRKKGTQTIEEKYVRKELISFTWGTGTYQLGSNWREFLDEDGNYIGPEDACPESAGPDKIIINKKGEIYIGDWLNKRTLIYDSKVNTLKKIDGRAIFRAPMCFDDDGNLYMGNRYANVIIKHNSQLKFIEEYSYDPGTLSKFFMRKRMHIGKDGNFYIRGNLWDEIILVNLKHKKINGKEVKFISATCIPKKSLVKIKEKIINGVIEEKKIKIVPQRSLKEIEIDLHVKGKYGWVQDIIGQDKEDNIFLHVVVTPSMGGIPEESKDVIQIYNKGGKFITEINLDQDDNLYFFQEGQEPLLDIDKEGNIYHLWIQKEGPKIIKWEKRNETNK